MSNMYETTKEINSESQVYRFIYLKDFFFLLMYATATIFLSNLVHSKVLVAYYIFSAIMAIILILPSYHNPKRRNYMAVLIFLKKDRTVYKPILGDDEDEE